MKDRVKILIVDDEKDLLVSLTNILKEELDVEVHSAENAEDAMTIAEREMPALILSDYYMPGEDGFEFCKRIKTHPELYDTSFLILTSASEITNLVKGLETGADDYITKPFHVEELLSRLKAHLRLKSLKDELKHDKEELERLNKELEEGLFGAVDLMTQLIGLRVPNATARGKRASEAALWMGKRLEMDDESLYCTDIAVRLHEIGKINLPDTLLRKSSDQLDELEKKALEQFPVFGHLIVSSIPRLKKVARYLRYQMENYDGTGYPDRLRGDEIPLPSRILRGINLAESLTTNATIEIDVLVDKIQKSRGTILDTRVAQLLAEFIKKAETQTWRENKKEIGLFELNEGMVIAEDICTGSGVKLLNKDSAITLPIIERLLAHHGVDPILNTVYIYKEKT